METRQKQQKMLGANGFKYREQHGVMVICQSVKHQEQTYNHLQALGYKKLKVVSV